MKNYISKIINEWDPVGIKTITPDDEYDWETSQIEAVIMQNPNITEKELAEVIKNILDATFDGLSVVNKKEIDKIASKILSARIEVKEKQ